MLTEKGELTSSEKQKSTPSSTVTESSKPRRKQIGVLLEVSGREFKNFRYTANETIIEDLDKSFITYTWETRKQQVCTRKTQEIKGKVKPEANIKIA